MKQLARIISSIFQPLLMPFYGVLLLLIYSPQLSFDSRTAIDYLSPVILFSFFVPALMILILYKKKIISDTALTKREERFLPYSFSFIGNLVAMYAYTNPMFPVWFRFLILASALAVLMAFVITLWWKISAHMIGVGGLLGGSMAICLCVYDINPVLLFVSLFILAIAVAVSRLILKRHTPVQVVCGFVLGYAIAFFSVYLGV